MSDGKMNDGKMQDDKIKNDKIHDEKILITQFNNRCYFVLTAGNGILSIQVQDQNKYKGGALSADAAPGSIYVGRVQNIATNIGAAFVDIQKGVRTFLSLDEAKNAIVTNRIPDGTLKAGDELLVQLVKEPIKTKLAGVSTRLSLAGSYVVVEAIPDIERLEIQARSDSSLSGRLRISKKLASKDMHKYKASAVLGKITENFNITVRTNAQDADITEVEKEAQELASQLAHILETGNKRVCFSRLYQPEPNYISFIKNNYRYEYNEIVTDIRAIYDELTKNSSLREYPIRFYEDDMLPLYKLYSLESRVRGLIDKKVWLKSGAYLVIEQTEALTAIDVNTGKYESHKNQEETYFKINLEAADAIAASLRARNLAGIILVDFINMSKAEHEEKLIQHMKELLKQDPVPAKVIDITGLGLMEITRQKKGKSLAEQLGLINRA